MLGYAFSRATLQGALAGDFFIFFHCLFIILFGFYLYNETFSFYLIIGQLISLYFSCSGLLGCSIQRLSRHLRSACQLMQRFGDFIARDNVSFDFKSLPGRR